MGKKRKYELDLDVERTMYSSFVTAANAVSQLYTQGVQQQRRAAAAASRATLEKVLSFVLRENAGAEHISKAALLQFLQHEYENADGHDMPGPQQPPMQFMPFGGPTAAAAAAAAGAAGSDDGQDVQQPKQSNRQMSGSSMTASPGVRGRMMHMDEQQQQQQLHHQQLHQQQQQQQQLHQQQHTHQHQQEAQAADAMQVQNSMMHMAASPFMTPGNMFMQQGNGMQ